MGYAAPSEPEVVEVVIHGPANRGWRARGLCHELGIDPELFYLDESEEPTTIDRLRGVCWRCPVQTQCLDYALANGERFGVWGGTSESERRRLARRVHGTPERYQHGRCRCTPCAAAYARKRAAVRELERFLSVAMIAAAELDVSLSQRMVV